MLGTDRLGFILGVACGILALSRAPAVAALDTGFSYQGRLVDGGLPATGSYDLEVKLFDAASAGGQVGSTLVLQDVSVISGVFSVTLDFGAGVFDGSDRWLEIGVRPGASSGAFTPLSPRQKLTPAPNALHASSAATVAGLSCSNGQVLKWSGAAWSCGADADTNSGGTVTSVGAGAGLNGGPITTSGTLSVNFGGSGAASSVARSDHDHGGTYLSTAVGTCPTGASIRTINPDGSVVCQAADPSPGFSMTALDATGDVGQYTSVAIGADGLGLISYLDLTNQDLKVAHCNDAACTSATTSTLDTAGGLYTSIAIGADGLGLISYKVGSALKVAHCNDTACTTATTASLDSAGNAGFHTSVAIGSDGLGLISHVSAGNGLRVAHCSDAACSTATLTTLQSGSGMAYTSVAIGADGRGLISYLEGGTNNLRVAHCSSTNCTSATLSTLDSAGTVGQFTSVAIGGDGLGLISYYDATNLDLKVAHCSNATCTSATLATLDSAGDVGQHTSLAIGADGLGLISYHDVTNGDLKIAHCANVSCTSAATTVVDGAGTVGPYTSIATAPDGLGFISYRDQTNLDLKVTHCANALCVPPQAAVAAAAPWSGVSSKPAGFADDVDNGVTAIVDGGGITGSVVGTTLTLGSDLSVQRRTAGSSLACAAGQYLQSVAQDGTPVCVADALGSDWKLSGNAGTTPGVDFIGTTDNAALEFRVNNSRVLRLERNGIPNLIGGFAGNSVTSGVFGAFIGGGGEGGLVNRVTDNYGVVGGGRSNQAGDGAGSTSDRGWATVGGGRANTASGEESTVAGGSGNIASGGESTVAGGLSNVASGLQSTVAGGFDNTASGSNSTVVGGWSSTAGGSFSFAAGLRAKVRDAAGSGDADGDEGTFVWADSTNADFQSTGPNQFLVRASAGVGVNVDSPAATLHLNGTTSYVLHAAGSNTGGSWLNLANSSSGGKTWNLVSTGSANGEGAGKLLLRSFDDGATVMTLVGTGQIGVGVVSPGAGKLIDTNAGSPGAHLTTGGAWTNSSDADAKENFRSLDGAQILRKLASVPIQEWSYKREDPSIRHVGPTAQDFRAAFGLGSDYKTISTIDPAGIALVAIQELHRQTQLLEAKVREVEELRLRLEQLEALIAERGSRSVAPAR